MTLNPTAVAPPGTTGVRSLGREARAEERQIERERVGEGRGEERI